MSDQFAKALWICIPAIMAGVVTAFAGTRLDLQIVAYGVLAMAAAFGIWATNARKHREEREAADREWKDALMERLDRGDKADRVLLRNELVSMHREFAEERQSITLEALEYAQNTYEVYHSLGGNGSGTKLWEDIKALPVREGR
jgi:hypothetical protein